MPATSEKILQLRQLLADRFVQAAFPEGEIYPTGLPVLDDVGIPRAALTEIVSSLASSAGGTLLL